MKRIFSILLILALCFALSACGGSSNVETTEGDVAQEKIEVDENLLTVDITIPASMYEGQDMSTFDAEAYRIEKGFNKAVVNEDGSVTVTMTKARHKEIVSEMMATVEESYQELINGTETPYIKNITYDKKLKEITVEVDREGYDNAFFDLTPFMVGLQANFYQLFAADDLHSEVIMKYQDNGEIISSIVYPDALNEETE